MNTKRLDAVVRSVPGLQSAARADENGRVVESAGPMDAEVACAVASLCAPHVAEIAALLGGGDVLRWCLTTQTMTACVAPLRGGLVVASAGPVKNPDALSRQLVLALADAKIS
jgi:hypothetical protein